MGVLDWLFGKSREEPVEASESFPWDHRPSVYEHIKAHIRSGQEGIAKGGTTLPDEERIAAKSRIKWAAGAMDGVCTHHMGSKDTDNASQLLKLVLAYSISPTVRNKATVYDLLLEQGAVSLVDPFLESLREQTSVNHDRLYDLAKSLTTESPDREPVKFGIAVLGLYGQPLDSELFRTLGRHEEFTLFCAVALGNTCEDGETELWELAKQVDGWGRIHLVERLSKTENPKIKDWLLRDGYKNSVMYEYLAFPCAAGGGLLAALERGEVDDDLLVSAAEIIQALIVGGPAQNMDDYQDGAIVAHLFLNKMEKQGHALAEFLAVSGLGGFLSDKEADWQARSERGWTLEQREEMMRQCSGIIQQPQWRDRVLAGLGSGNEQEFYNADRAARVLQIDAWPFHWERLKKQPLQSSGWFGVMRDCDASRITDVIALAESTLPLQIIASGPGMEMGFGPEYEGHTCLGYILQELGRFPGLGMSLIETGLRCATIRNRNMALKALSEWKKENWPSNVVSLLKVAFEREPDQEVKRRMGNVLAGKPLDAAIAGKN
jgi:hypothetical protein